MALSRYCPVQHPLPLITPRIEFRVSPRQALPAITPRLEFEVDPEHKHNPRTPSTSLEGTAAEGQHGVNTDTTPPSPQSPQLPQSSQPLQTPQTPQPSTSRSRSRSRSPTPSVTRDQAVIPKPGGEPGRPRSGGFNLESTLVDLHSWSVADVEKLTDFVSKEARRNLDPSVSYRSQRVEAINKICDKASGEDHFPILKDYDNCWPVRSSLKLILKYKSEASRRSEGRAATLRIRKAVEGTS